MLNQVSSLDYDGSFQRTRDVGFSCSSNFVGNRVGIFRLRCFSSVFCCFLAPCEGLNQFDLCLSRGFTNLHPILLKAGTQELYVAHIACQIYLHFSIEEDNKEKRGYVNRLLSPFLLFLGVHHSFDPIRL